VGGLQARSREKIERFVQAMRQSLATRGAARSTFAKVAKDAGLPRSVLHYYFKTREALMAEVVRREGDPRAVRTTRPLARAHSRDDVLAAMLGRFEELTADAGQFRILFELFVASFESEEIREELAAMYEHRRIHVGAMLEAKQAEEVVGLRHDSHAVISVAYALSHGFAMQQISDPERDHSKTIEAGVDAMRYLLGGNEESP
jgi:AcrR family transcriptional regulator